MTLPVPGMQPPPEPEQLALPRELVLFLIQLSVVLNKSRAYPAGHPMLTASLGMLATHLFGLLKAQPLLVVGVTRQQLLMDGKATDPGHAVLRDLATRIHRHQIAAITFRQGVEEATVGALLGALANETWRQGRPLGLEPPEALADRWPCVTVEPLPFHQLELGEADSVAARRGSRADQIWQGLVNIAVLFSSEGGEADGEGDGVSTGAPVSGAAAARTITARRGDHAYSQAVVEWMMQTGDELAEVDPESLSHQRVVELFAGLDEETLDSLLALGATFEQRRELVFRAARSLPVGAVLDLLQAAARTSNHPVPQPLLRILAKLASHLETSRGAIVPGAGEVLRDSVRQLVGSWDAEATSTAPHRHLLELLSRPVLAVGAPSGKATATRVRVVQLGLELDADAPAITAAMQQLTLTSPLAPVLELAEGAERLGLNATRLVALLCEPGFIRDRLLDEQEEMALIGRLLDRMGEEAAVPLLEALEQAQSASRRRIILQRLEEVGHRLGPMLVARLPGKPWFVQRNLLGLLGALPVTPPGFSAAEYARHENARVRREAYKLLLADPGERAAAILTAATDPDPGIVLMALVTANQHFPAELGVRLLGWLEGSYRDPQVRAAAIRLLGARPSNAARDWLLNQVVTTRGWLWFKRTTLRPRSTELLAALPVLARAYGRHAGVQSVLRLAANASDAEIRAAARGGKE